MRHRERGFTLVETLVALVILMVVGVIFFQQFVAGTRANAIADQSHAALSVARAQLAALGHERPLAAGVDNGLAGGGLSWTTNVKPYLEADRDTRNAVVPNAFWATVTVQWFDQRSRKKRSLQLTTLKLGEAP